MPTLVLCRSKDRSNVPLSRELAAGIPAAELRIVPGATHLWNLQQPEEVQTAPWPRSSRRWRPANPDEHRIAEGVRARLRSARSDEDTAAAVDAARPLAGSGMSEPPASGTTGGSGSTDRSRAGVALDDE